ncbi:MAG: hypothetical protein B6D61_10910 [Bacteroidetes bacterium 4484_249]|nr:MAG: hypothetical protein B6D61_10910 [Bacteroidetes bacterium 4484_249]
MPGIPNIIGALHLIFKVGLFVIKSVFGTVINFTANYISEITREQTIRIRIYFLMTFFIPSTSK